MLYNPARREHVLNLWENQGIDTGYFWIDLPTLQSNPQACRSFISDAHARGIKAVSLDGDPSFVLPGARHTQVITRFQSVLSFNAAGGAHEQFDGAHFDNERWLLLQWNTDMATTIQQYLTLSSEYIQMRDAAGSSMAIGADAGFILAATQFPEINNTPWEGVTKPTYKHIQDSYDNVTLMDYRDFALGTDSIVFHAQPWLDYGDSIGKPVEIGVETLGPQFPEKVTFFDDGIAFMEKQLDIAESQFLARPSFDGFAIHHLGAYEPQLLAEATPGDFNLDAVVDQFDLDTFQQHYGQTSQSWTQGGADALGVGRGGLHQRIRVTTLTTRRSTMLVRKAVRLTPSSCSPRVPNYNPLWFSKTFFAFFRSVLCQPSRWGGQLSGLAGADVEPRNT